jgi:hypothetical protein
LSSGSGKVGSTPDPDFDLQPIGDRVQWFRAEAEVCRWLEQVELKHVEFLRLLDTFQYMSQLWKNASQEKPESPHLQSYARRQSTIYCSLRNKALQSFKDSYETELIPNGIADLDNLTFAKLLPLIQAFREKKLQDCNVAE